MHSKNTASQEHKPSVAKTTLNRTLEQCHPASYKQGGLAGKASVQEKTKALGFPHRTKGPENGGCILTSLKSWFRYKLSPKVRVLKV